jgi:hypothetical protein
MVYGLEDVRNTLASITQQDYLIDMLYEYERTLDEVGIKAYRNWYAGELLDGPRLTKYWMTCKFMYPEKLMPDPDGALRLTKIGCEVNFTKDILKKPVKITSPRDWKNNNTKEAKIEEKPVWVVTIAMPIKYITDNFDQINAYLENDDDLMDNEQIADGYSEDEEPANAMSSDDEIMDTDFDEEI